MTCSPYNFAMLDALYVSYEVDWIKPVSWFKRSFPIFLCCLFPTLVLARKSQMLFVALNIGGAVRFVQPCLLTSGLVRVVIGISVANQNIKQVAPDGIVHVPACDKCIHLR